jgi:hypothetical protein
MGHDIYALKNYKKWIESYDKEPKLSYNKRNKKYVVAYLRFGMWNTNSHKWYKEMGLEVLDNNCSGNGECIWANLEQIKDAREILEDNEDNDIKEWFEKVIKYCEKKKINMIEVCCE